MPLQSPPVRIRAQRWCIIAPAREGFGRDGPKMPPSKPTRGALMIEWDDVRYFLAVARGGSVRSAAEQLGVNHSTILRRVAQLE
ncbi:MAG: helix-turn-helix domain-containing protein, partial [Acetobacteraceae bacterium]